MAKRRPEHLLCLHPPSKRLCRARRPGDTQVGSWSATGGVDSPSLLAVPGSRSRKRGYSWENPDERTQEEASLVLTERTSGCCSTNDAPSCSSKRPRSHTVSPKTRDKADDDGSTEDCSYNSFQFWRSPLAAPDLSLLEELRSQEEGSSKVKDSPDAMET
ncbi:hypothetical protein D4764_05G0014260 [Takifugu flavidus]|uniref:WW-binding domain-containing protein n=1 Tax=Takifugu flavidus TaxID=433684 RepID=A0A5C6N285_9TELE|nr:hypothetical protein D4764_05G0014260 [Takifugu flavidus]|eukprot:XP_011618422.1 PREDICTED: uncharacterized protein C9orf40 homolog [Takifugu rubripes]